MSAVDFASLPADVSAALRATFGGAAIDELALLSGGLSQATLLTFSVSGTPYVLKKGDPTRAARAFACLKIASELGVAPRLVYAEPSTAISIMERIVGAPLGRGPSTFAERTQRVAAALRRLHQGPAFAPGAPLAEFFRVFDAQLKERAGEGIPPDLVRTVEELTPSLARYAGSAPCHKDLNPNNVLEVGDRIYFVDWDTAGAGDPFVDLAQLGVFAFPRPEDRASLLEAYLGRHPNEEERARAIVTRVVALAVYATAFLHVHALSGAPAAPAAPAPPVPLAELFPMLAAARERTHPGMLAASLVLEVRTERATDAFAQAKSLLARA